MRREILESEMVNKRSQRLTLDLEKMKRHKIALDNILKKKEWEEKLNFYYFFLYEIWVRIIYRQHLQQKLLLIIADCCKS